MRLLIYIFSIFTVSGVAFAQPFGTVYTVPCSLNLCDLGETVERIAAVIFTFSIPIFSIMILVGGFMIMAAGGEEEKISKGRKTLLYALIGFVIILLSASVPAIIRSIFP
jgi:hypothetical protein